MTNTPETIHASPQDAPWLDDPEMTFWRPTLKDASKVLGWRWVLLLPIPAVLALTFVAFYYHFASMFLTSGGVKLMLIAYGAAAGAAVAAFKSATRNRKDPFCIRCGYSLIGLPEGHVCPECGLPVNHAIVNEYRRDPEGFVQRWQARHRLPPKAEAFVVPEGARRRKSRDGT